MAISVTRKSVKKVEKKAAKPSARKPATKPTKKAAKKVARKSATRPSGGIGDAAVLKATGHTWPEWIKALDAAGCRTMSHREIVAVVRDAHGIGPWWQQMVTVGYERARGLRKPYQVTGGYTANASRTIQAPATSLYDAWYDVTRRRRWLKDPDIDFRRVAPPKSMRITWIDSRSSLVVRFAPRGVDRSVVTIEHEKLKSTRQVREMKAYWSEALSRLKELLEA